MQTITKPRDWAIALDDALCASKSQGWIGLSMATAAGVALLAVAAGLMSPPPAPMPSARLSGARAGIPGQQPLAPLQSRVHAAAAEDPTVMATHAAPHADLPQVRVAEADLGLRLMPGSMPVPDSGWRQSDGAGGEALALSLSGSGTLEAAVQFYRQQLSAGGLPSDAVQVLRPSDDRALLRAQSLRGDAHTVWIVQNGNVLDIMLARVRPGSAASR